MRLGWPAYYAKVDTTEGKMQQLRAWIENSKFIVVTKALGLGINVGDVRLVIYAGILYNMLDYVQESGRAG